MPYDVYRAHVPGWATSLELVSELPPEEREPAVPLRVLEGSRFLVAILTTPSGMRPGWRNPLARLSIANEGSRFGEAPLDSDRIYVSGGESLSLLVIHDPVPGDWSIEVEFTGRPIPIAANLMVFHPAIATMQEGRPPSPSVPPGGSTFKCRACKTTAKALALSIAAAATLPALPQALITAVASFLGVGMVVASTFILSVLGDAADVLAEALCRRVRLC